MSKTLPDLNRDVSHNGGVVATLEVDPAACDLRRQVDQLRPSNSMGACFAVIAILTTTLGVTLSISSNWWIWIVGQIALAFSLLQWFAMLHEAGHRTLFRNSWANHLFGHLAGFFALVPFPCWKVVHARHHRWTGWQDMDTTTASLVPRKLHFLERLTIDICWATGLPLFSILYRLGNYWYYPRIATFFKEPRHLRILRIGIICYSFLYFSVVTLAILALGPRLVVATITLPLLLTLMMQDPLILSQHTHIPMRITLGSPAIQAIPPIEQGKYTRSLLFPKWFAFWVLINMDAHELHHMLPRVPGYYLHRLNVKTDNSIAWWRWLWYAKRVRGHVLLFQNRDVTGHAF